MYATQAEYFEGWATAEIASFFCFIHFVDYFRSEEAVECASRILKERTSEHTLGDVYDLTIYG